MSRNQARPFRIRDLFSTSCSTKIVLDYGSIHASGFGTFDDWTLQAGLGSEAWGTSAVWFDADGDHHADLYVTNYLDVTRENHHICTYGGVPGYCGPGQWGDGVDDLLYLNTGDGRFHVVESATWAKTSDAKGLAVAVADFDDDSIPEIYVGNDMAPNFLLKRRSPSADGPLYQNVASTSGCAVSGDGRNEASMGVACADFDGDGQVDIFLTHYYQHKNTLYRNLGALLFEDDSRRSRAAATSFATLGFGTVARDFDFDGDIDLFIANGHVLGPEHEPNAMTPQLLVNDGTGLFHDVSRRIGDYFDQPCLGRGAAGGDYDNDGLVDLAISHLDEPLAILHNQTPTSVGFIGLHLLSSDRAYPAGGKLTIQAGEQRIFVPLVWGESYLSSGDPRVVVAIGASEGPVDVMVAWPGGETQHYPQLSPNRYWLLREAGGALAAANPVPRPLR